MSYLVDTSVLTRLSRPTVRQLVEALAGEGRVARASISDLELGYAARNESEWLDLMEAIGALALVETTSDHVRRALQVQRVLATRSQRGRKIPDLLIAAAAEAAGLVILHYDTDFDIIAGATGQSCEWVVPRGSVD